MAAAARDKTLEQAFQGSESTDAILAYLPAKPETEEYVLLQQRMFYLAAQYQRTDMCHALLPAEDKKSPLFKALEKNGLFYEPNAAWFVLATYPQNLAFFVHFMKTLGVDVNINGVGSCDGTITPEKRIAYLRTIGATIEADILVGEHEAALLAIKRGGAVTPAVFHAYCAVDHIAGTKMAIEKNPNIRPGVVGHYDRLPLMQYIDIITDIEGDYLIALNQCLIFLKNNHTFFDTSIFKVLKPAPLFELLHCTEYFNEELDDEAKEDWTSIIEPYLILQNRDHFKDLIRVVCEKNQEHRLITLIQQSQEADIELNQAGWDLYQQVSDMMHEPRFTSYQACLETIQTLLIENNIIPTGDAFIAYLNSALEKIGTAEIPHSLENLLAINLNSSADARAYIIENIAHAPWPEDIKILMYHNLESIDATHSIGRALILLHEKSYDAAARELTRDLPFEHFHANHLVQLLISRPKAEFIQPLKKALLQRLDRFPDEFPIDPSDRLNKHCLLLLYVFDVILNKDASLEPRRKQLRAQLSGSLLVSLAQSDHPKHTSLIRLLSYEHALCKDDNLIEKGDEDDLQYLMTTAQEQNISPTWLDTFLSRDETPERFACDAHQDTNAFIQKGALDYAATLVVHGSIDSVTRFTPKPLFLIRLLHTHEGMPKNIVPCFENLRAVIPTGTPEGNAFLNAMNIWECALECKFKDPELQRAVINIACDLPVKNTAVWTALLESILGSEDPSSLFMEHLPTLRTLTDSNSRFTRALNIIEVACEYNAYSETLATAAIRLMNKGDSLPAIKEICTEINVKAKPSDAIKILNRVLEVMPARSTSSIHIESTINAHTPKKHKPLTKSQKKRLKQQRQRQRQRQKQENTALMRKAFSALRDHATVLRAQRTETAAITIQTRARSFLTQRSLKRQRHTLETMKHAELKLAAHINLQRLGRGFLARKNTAPLKAQRKAAIVVRKHTRRHLARRNFAATRIQSWARGVTTRTALNTARKESIEALKHTIAQLHEQLTQLRLRSGARHAEHFTEVTRLNSHIQHLEGELASQIVAAAAENKSQRAMLLKSEGDRTALLAVVGEKDHHIAHLTEENRKQALAMEKLQARLARAEAFIAQRRHGASQPHHAAKMHAGAGARLFPPGGSTHPMHRATPSFTPPPYQIGSPLPRLERSKNTADIVCCIMTVDSGNNITVRVCAGESNGAGAYIFTGPCAPFTAQMTSVAQGLTIGHGEHNLALNIEYSNAEKSHINVEKITVYDPKTNRPLCSIKATSDIALCTSTIKIDGSRVFHGTTSASPRA
jgi:hypothetical protein